MIRLRWLSAFSFKAGEYCSQRGINTRKAGEDFYFLQKFFDLGSFTECNHIRIIPSPRPSDRVPFGTGPSVIERVKSGKELKVFHPELFRIVGAFIKKIPSSHTHSDNLKSGNHPLIPEFPNINNIQSVVSEIRANSSGPQAYTKRFFRWFNMFRVLKFMNHGRKTFPDIPVSMAASELLGDMKIDSSGNTVELLIRLRKRDRNK
jgi:hypothetical protein